MSDRGGSAAACFGWAAVCAGAAFAGFGRRLLMSPFDCDSGFSSTGVPIVERDAGVEKRGPGAESCPDDAPALKTYEMSARPAAAFVTAFMGKSSCCIDSVCSMDLFLSQIASSVLSCDLNCVLLSEKPA